MECKGRQRFGNNEDFSILFSFFDFVKLEIQIVLYFSQGNSDDSLCFADISDLGKIYRGKFSNKES